MGAADSDDYARHKQQFGNRLRRLRTQAGMSQMALARLLTSGADVSQVSRWERGVTLPNFDTLVELADRFNVPPGWLEWGDQTEAP